VRVPGVWARQAHQSNWETGAGSTLTQWQSLFSASLGTWPTAFCQTDVASTPAITPSQCYLLVPMKISVVHFCNLVEMNHTSATL
jgi:hypothetical protein